VGRRYRLQFDCGVTPSLSKPRFSLVKCHSHPNPLLGHSRP
jgi:hypothetical protein